MTIDRMDDAAFEAQARELETLQREDLDALDDAELDARFREALAFGRECGQRQFEALNLWLAQLDEAFDAACSADLAPGQRLAWMRRLGGFVETLVLNLRDEPPGPDPEACPYQAVLDELAALATYTREERLRERLRTISAARGWSRLDDLDRYDDACRAIDVREVAQAYGWTPPQAVLELLFESSLAALRAQEGLPGGAVPRAG